MKARRIAGLFLVVLGLVALSPLSTVAADHRYEESVVTARGLVREARDGSRDRIPDAIHTLENGTGGSQPEILADLRATPPNLADADARLAAVEAALNRPADGGDPTQARNEVRKIIALPRYDSIRGGQSPWDRFLNWMAQALAAILLFLLMNTKVTPGLLYGLAGGLVLLVIGAAYLVVRSNWRRGGGAQTFRNEEVRAAIRDRFAAADRLAAEGDPSAALRELVAAVASEVGNRPFWETSPLTVRELFAGEGVLDRLRPLLEPFEASVYGRREVLPESLRAAMRVAEPFRSATIGRAA